MAEHKEENVLVNKKASHEYNLEQRYEAGLMLLGTEIKSIRLGNVNLNGAFCFFRDGELFIRDMYIAPYENSGYASHEPRRERKLLLKSAELKKMEAKKEKGMTIVPTRVFLSTSGYAKLEVALASGKKGYDKREDLKEKDAKRDLGRSLAE